jgi:hypothetical protein
VTDLNGFDHASIKALATELGRPAASLCALAQGNDPFFIYPARRAKAEWFAALLPTLDLRTFYLRRVHYLLVSLSPPPRWPDGRPYNNTEGDWRALSRAGSDARYLKLIDPERFVDHGIDAPRVHTPTDLNAPAWLQTTDQVEAPAPEETPASSYLPEDYEFPEQLPHVLVVPPRFAEPYAIEFWVEKSTLTDILQPLCSEHNVTLVTGVGEMSATQCYAVVNRAREHGRKTRIFYLSDFDPAGSRMPVSVARKIEYLVRSEHPDLDIRLDPLALTLEQCQHYQLPRTPIKDSDRSRPDFEARYGSGATELDALEALHPGELAKIVTKAIRRYRRPTQDARRRNGRIASDLNNEAFVARDRVIAGHQAELDQLRADFEAMRARITPHQEALERLADEFEERCAHHTDAINEEVATFYADAADVHERMGDELRSHAPDLHLVEWAEPASADDDDDPLFDSTRDYEDQIERYRQHQGRSP